MATKARKHEGTRSFFCDSSCLGALVAKKIQCLICLKQKDKWLQFYSYFHSSKLWLMYCFLTNSIQHCNKLYYTHGTRMGNLYMTFCVR
jgi:hypothetical protein